MPAIRPADIEAAVRALVTAQPLSIGIEVTVPVAYGGGDIVSVIVEQEGESFVAHDAGVGAMQLSAAGVTVNRAVAARLAELAARFRCSFEDGRVSARGAVEDVGVTACLVANASRAVADYVLEVRRQLETDFRIVVTERIREIVGPRLRENEEFRGKSGRRYRVPAMLLNSTGSAPAHFIAALAHRHNVERNFAMFWDLRRSFPDVENDAVYDEAGDFRDEDRELLSSVSTPITLMEAPLRFRAMAGHG